MSIRSAVQIHVNKEVADANAAIDRRIIAETEALHEAFAAMFAGHLADGESITTELVLADGRYEYATHPMLRWDGYRFQYRTIQFYSHSPQLYIVFDCGKCERPTLHPLTTAAWAGTLEKQIAQAEKYARTGIGGHHGDRRTHEGCTPPTHEPRWRCTQCGKGPEEHA